MCEYLFAGFSLKQRTDEGLTPAQLEAVERWRGQLYGIATQEMAHLALVNNLLAALGAAPHLSRPNLPQRGRHYPDDVWLVLLPFGEQALRHFLYLERPEGMEVDDIAAADAHASALPVLTPDDIVPRGQDFATVGHLYRAVQAGFRRLVQRYRQEWTFVGPPQAQITGDLFRWPELIAVTDLASACTAVETIIEEGEGARGNWREAHFGRFLRVLDEYLHLRAEDPDFEPARPVVAASVRPPADAEPGAPVEDPVTAAVLDVFDVAYEVLLQLLERFFGHSDETPAQLAALADTAVGPDGGRPAAPGGARHDPAAAPGGPVARRRPQLSAVLRHRLPAAAPRVGLAADRRTAGRAGARMRPHPGQRGAGARGRGAACWPAAPGAGPPRTARRGPPGGVRTLSGNLRRPRRRSRAADDDAV